MATQIRTLDLLPNIFRTETNRQFLSATLDVLTQQPRLNKVQGFIGDKYGYTVNSADKYVVEPTKTRTDYQLDPSVVFLKSDTQTPSDFISYPGIIQALENEGGVTDNNDRMFENQFYSWDPFVDLDKIVNHSQYYWIPNGPDSVTVTVKNTIKSSYAYTVTKTANGYVFNDTTGLPNPVLSLIRGGTYTFTVDQDSDFWLQGLPGLEPYVPGTQINTREIYGAVNNGTNDGVITFTVPYSDAQAGDIKPGNQTVNLVAANLYPVFDTTVGPASLTITAIDYVTATEPTTPDTTPELTVTGTIPTGVTEVQISGIVPADHPLNGQIVYMKQSASGKVKLYTDNAATIEVNSGRNAGVNSNTLWPAYTSGGTVDPGYFVLKDGPLITDNNVFIIDDIDAAPGQTIMFYDNNDLASQDNFYVVTSVVAGKVAMAVSSAITIDENITVTNGVQYIGRSFYRDETTLLNTLVSYNSSVNRVLYYQDGTDAQLVGTINVFLSTSEATVKIDEILGAKNYVAPNGVKFTNGLKVTFDDSVRPLTYNGKEYYVEGVGSSINLVPVNNLAVPEIVTYATTLVLSSKNWSIGNWDEFSWDSTDTAIAPTIDYIVASRNSRDLNSWTRVNRWFHIDVINETQRFNGTATTSAANAPIRANRPIIEFQENLDLYNSGNTIGGVTLFDTSVSNAFIDIQGQSSYQIDGTELTDGDTVVFSRDVDLDVRGKVYIVRVVQNSITLNVTPQYNIVDDSELIAISGRFNIGKSFVYDSVTKSWRQAQTKTRINQPPLFDILDSNGYSLSDELVYPETTFDGTELFSFTLGTGVDDAVLGFPLSYSSATNVGDINFTVNLNSDTFSYLSNGKTVTKNVNVGFVNYYPTATTVEKKTGWITAAAPSTQYQAFEFTITPLLETEFVCNVPPRPDPVWNVAQVYVGETLLNVADFLVSEITVNSVPSTQVILSNDVAVVPGQKVTVLLLSDVASADAYYTIPANLQNNPFNVDVTTVDVGSIKNQYASIFSNTPNALGPVFGDNNLHDLGPTNQYGSAIIQSSASLVLPGVFNRNGAYNLFDSLQYNRDQYVKYKQMVVDLAKTTNFSTTQSPEDILNDIISIITSTRTSDSFKWTDMVPSGSPSAVNNYVIGLAVSSQVFSVSQIYNFTSANYQGLSVYVSRANTLASKTIQLIRDTDYTVSDENPTVTVTYPLDVGDTVTIVQYNKTYGSYCPNTPTKLGLYPKFLPQIYTNTSYKYPTTFIIGHDGSQTKLYGTYDATTNTFSDFRDLVLFELEKRIYNNLKVDTAPPLRASDIFPGQFRTTEYTWDELLTIYSSEFLNWVGQNRIDYKTQQYDASNSFSCNYRDSQNKLLDPLVQPETSLLQGYWRGVYRWFFDTVSPNTTPWEMLGFSEPPSWWESYYGPAPYTSTNTLLWNDLAAGRVYNAGSPYILPQYARPQLLEVMPVDTAGNLVSPLASVVNDYTQLSFEQSWVVGDQAPAENSYLVSSSWPFDLMRIQALTKPAKFYNLNADRDLYVYNQEFDQYLYNDRYHLDPRNLIIYGDGTAKHSYINWIVDYVYLRGVNATENITNLIKNVDVRLTYQLAGFSGKNYLKFLIEKSTPNGKTSSLLIPDDSYSVLLYDNVPVDQINYSSVIVQKTERGWTVWGNSQDKNYFRVAVPKLNGVTESITVGGSTVTVNADYYQDRTTLVPYGTMFFTVQGISNFLASYGRYLTDQGVGFYNENTVGQQNNWARMIELLLSWTNQSWEVGSTVALNPSADLFQIDRDSLIVQPLTIQQQNFVLNQNLVPIQQQDLAVLRDGTVFSLASLNPNDVVSYTNLNLSAIEHAVVFDNYTVFNDTIYDTSTGLRQPRLLFQGYKSAEWNGSINAQGFFVNQDNIEEWQQNAKYTKGQIVTYKGFYWVANTVLLPTETFNENDWTKSTAELVQAGIFPNPSTEAYDSTQYYNPLSANLENDADLLSFSLIGFRPRPYMAAADLSDTTQINVYKNILEQKGTNLIVNSFKAAEFAQGKLDYEVQEIWGIKNGDFGSVLNSNFVEMTLDQTELTGNPFTIGFLSDAAFSPVISQNAIRSIQVTNPGYGYTLAPTVVIRSTNGSGATATAAIDDFEVKSITVNTYGSEYESTTTVTVTRPFGGDEWSVGAETVAGNIWYYTSNGVENFYLTTSAGTFGLFGPTHTSDIQQNGTAVLEYIGSTAQAAPTITNIIGSVQVTNGGSNYNVPPEVVITGTQTLTGTTATATATIANGTVIAVTVTDPGSGYITAAAAAVGGDAVSVQQSVSLDSLINYQQKPTTANFLPPYTNSYMIQKGIPTAGYVNLNDAKVQAYQVTNLNDDTTNYTNLYRRDAVWLADYAGSWDVFAPASVNTQVISVNNNLNSTITFNFAEPHGLVKDDIFAVINFDEQVNGYYTVTSAPNLTSVIVTFTLDASVITINGNGVALKLVSQRTTQASDIATESMIPWSEFYQSYHWVDEYDTTGNWAVFEQAPTYSTVTARAPGVGKTLLGRQVEYRTNFGLLAAAAPGVVYYYPVSGDTVLIESSTSSFGQGLALATDYMYIADSTGITVYELTYDSATGTYTPSSRAGVIQILQTLSVENTGQLAVSNDGQWLYVLDSANNTVKLFGLNASGVYELSNTITVTGATNIATSTDGVKLYVGTPGATVSSLAGAGQVQVYSRGLLSFNGNSSITSYTVPYSFDADTTVVLINDTVTSEYVISGSDIVFTTAPSTGSRIEIQTGNLLQVAALQAPTPRQGASFGYSVDTNRYGADVVIGAPGDSYPVEAGLPSDGTVYRYTNGAQLYGTTTLTAPFTTVNTDVAYFDGYKVTFTGTNTPVAIRDAINTQTPINIVATVSGNNVVVGTVVGSPDAPYNIIDIVASTAVQTRLGLTLYTNTQKIGDPYNNTRAQFGQTVRLNETSSLVVGAPVATGYRETSFDVTDDRVDNDTQFDNGSTTFIDGFANRGAVYIYDYLSAYNETLVNTGSYTFGQSLSPSWGTLTTAAQPMWGQQLSFSGLTVAAGAPGLYTNNAGAVYTFASTTVSNWSVDKQPSSTVDINRLNNISIYDLQTNDTLEYLDYIDPVQGKQLGAVASNLNFIIDSDPANYDSGSIRWGIAQVGTTWLDTSTMRMLDYHQPDLNYNAQYWALPFPGSSADVYTWVQSSVEPLDYNGPGFPKDLGTFITVEVEDLSSNRLVNEYYFWVKNYNAVPANKTLAPTTVSQYVLEPQSSGIAYLAPLSLNSVGVFNANDYVADNTSALHIGYSVGKNADVGHQSWLLVNDNSTDSFLTGLPAELGDNPTDLYLKYIDSFAGINYVGQAVPDPALPALLRYGVSVRPRQSMFVNRLLAVENYISYANNILIEFPAAEQTNLNFLNMDPTENYWQYVNWWAEGYSNSTKPNVLVQSPVDLYTSVPNKFNGIIVGVESNYQGRGETYTWSDTTGWVRIGLALGTIQFLNTLYTASSVSTNQKIATRNIVRWLNESFYTNTLAIHRNTSLMLMFEFIESEALENNNYLPWLNKTSFVDVAHNVRRLIAYKKFQRDNTEFLEGYLNEVKPYHVVIKDFILKYEGQDDFLGDVTDFDVPSLYNEEINSFTSPQLIYTGTPGSDQYLPSAAIWGTESYTNWFSNFGLSVGLDGEAITQVKTVAARATVYSLAQNLLVGQTTATLNTTVGLLPGPVTIGVDRFYIESIDSPTTVTITALSAGQETHSPSSILNGLSIYLSDVIGIPAAGTVFIGSELVSYSGINQWTGALLETVRGLDGTDATAHPIGTTVEFELSQVTVLNPGRAYTNAPIITANIDTSLYPVPTDAIELNPIMTPYYTDPQNPVPENIRYKMTSVEVINPGKGYAVTPTFSIGPSITTTFTANAATNTLVVSSATLETGDGVVYTATGDTGPEGLVNAQYYYVRVETDIDPTGYTVSLHNTFSDAVHYPTDINDSVELFTDGVGTLGVTPLIQVYTNNQPTREIRTILNYDRTAYRSSVTPWAPTIATTLKTALTATDTTVSAFPGPVYPTVGTIKIGDEIMSYTGLYINQIRDEERHVIDSELLFTNVTRGINRITATFVGSITGDTLTVTSITAGDDIEVGMTLSAPASGTITGFISGSGGVGTYSVDVTQTVLSQTLVASISSATSHSVDVDINSWYTTGTLVLDNGILYRCIVANDDVTFDSDNWARVFSDDPLLTAADRITAFYNPTINMPGNDITQLMTGVEYPNNTYLGLELGAEKAWSITPWSSGGWEDGDVSSLYDTYLASPSFNYDPTTNPTTYDVVGSNFEFGYGPEELLPGLTTDVLNFQVETKPGSSWNPLTILHNSGNTTTATRTAEIINPIGTPTIDTIITIADGSESMQFRQISSYYEIPYSNENFDLIDTDFTIEFWFNTIVDSITGNKQIFTNATESSIEGWSIGVTEDHEITFVISNGIDGLVTYSTAADVFTDGTWTNVAMVKTGAELSIYVNGTAGNISVNGGSATSSSVPIADPLPSTNPILIGQGYEVSGGIFEATTTGYIGYLQELRVSTAARYEADYTPATTAFDNDSDTVLLVHPTGVSGTAIVTDDVGTRISGTGYGITTFTATVPATGATTVSFAGRVDNPVAIDVYSLVSTNVYNTLPLQENAVSSGTNYSINWLTKTVTFDSSFAGATVKISVYEIGGGNQYSRSNSDVTPIAEVDSDSVVYLDFDYSLFVAPSVTNKNSSVVVYAGTSTLAPLTYNTDYVVEQQADSTRTQIRFITDQSGQYITWAVLGWIPSNSTVASAAVGATTLTFTGDIVDNLVSGSRLSFNEGETALTVLSTNVSAGTVTVAALTTAVTAGTYAWYYNPDDGYSVPEVQEFRADGTAVSYELDNYFGDDNANVAIVENGTLRLVNSYQRLYASDSTYAFRIPIDITTLAGAFDITKITLTVNGTTVATGTGTSTLRNWGINWVAGAVVAGDSAAFLTEYGFNNATPEVSTDVDHLYVFVNSANYTIAENAPVRVYYDDTPYGAPYEITVASDVGTIEFATAPTADNVISVTSFERTAQQSIVTQGANDVIVNRITTINYAGGIFATARITTAQAHGLLSGAQVKIDSLYTAGSPLNERTFYADVVTTTSVDLYYDADLTLPVTFTGPGYRSSANTASYMFLADLLRVAQPSFVLNDTGRLYVTIDGQYIDPSILKLGFDSTHRYSELSILTEIAAGSEVVITSMTPHQSPNELDFRINVNYKNGQVVYNTNQQTSTYTTGLYDNMAPEIGDKIYVNDIDKLVASSSSTQAFVAGFIPTSVTFVSQDLPTPSVTNVTLGGENSATINNIVNTFVATGTASIKFSETRSMITQVALPVIGYNQTTNVLTLDGTFPDQPEVGAYMMVVAASAEIVVDDPAAVKTVTVSNGVSTIASQFSVTPGNTISVLLPRVSSNGSYMVRTVSGDAVIINGENIIFGEIGSDPVLGSYITRLQRGVGKTVTNFIIPENTLVQSIMISDAIPDYDRPWYNYTGLPLQYNTNPLAQLLQVGTN